MRINQSEGVNYEFNLYTHHLWACYNVIAICVVLAVAVHFVMFDIVLTKMKKTIDMFEYVRLVELSMTRC